MYKDKKIAVVVPAYNEENFIPMVIETMPDYVDRIVIVNDCSTDKTKDVVEKLMAASQKIILIDHPQNRGLGQSLIDGYLKSLETDADISVVMAGDAQMDPADLPRLLDKITDQNYDYVKGNRLLHKELKGSMPKHRIIGNAFLTILTKFATGYFSIMDPQCGYTAITNEALSNIPIKDMTKGYGYNADILCMLNILGFRATDVEVRPVYEGQKSGIKLWQYIPKVSFLLVTLFFKRICMRYLVRDFHPLVFFYFMSMVLIPIGIWKGYWTFCAEYICKNSAIESSPIMTVLLLVVGIQSLFFAIWFDSNYSK